MKYSNLSELIYASLSSRRFFMSQAPETQMILHIISDEIHSAAELHEKIYAIQAVKRLSELNRTDKIYRSYCKKTI